MKVIRGFAVVVGAYLQILYNITTSSCGEYKVYNSTTLMRWLRYVLRGDVLAKKAIKFNCIVITFSVPSNIKITRNYTSTTLEKYLLKQAFKVRMESRTRKSMF